KKIAATRYLAKCIYCDDKHTGKPKKLHAHVLTCESWPATEKSSNITNDKSTVKLKQQESLTHWVKPMSQSQQARLDENLLNTIIYNNLSFTLVNNTCFANFLKDLALNYNLPSASTISTLTLNLKFSTHLAKKLDIMPNMTNITVALDRWQDISNNSIYSFMALKEDQNYVLNIIDLVATFEKDFQHCIELSKTSDYPVIKTKIQEIINNYHYFANNDTLVMILTLIANAISHLETSDTTLADIFKKFINAYYIISVANTPSLDSKNML
ncbi:9987_t:CDS:2, partial [Cetraspora pellucida]